MQLKNDIEKHIEVLVAERKTLKAITEIKKYLVKNKKFTESRIKAANWYRRLGLRMLALRVLESEISGNIDLDSPLGEEQLILCYILNLVGSSKYAMRILSNINMNKIPERLLSMVGNIYLSNYCYSEALPLLDKAITTHPNPNSDTYNLVLISKADVLCGLNSFSKAISITENIYHNRKQDIVKFIAASALGEYLIKAKEHKKALKVLEEQKPYIKEEDHSTDIGFWWKWMGVSYLLNGRIDQGLSALKKAMDVLYNPRNKPESSLEVLYWIGYGNKLKNKIELPEEWKRLLVYPSFNLNYSINLQKQFEKMIFHLSGEKMEFSYYSSFLKSIRNHLIDEISNIEHIKNNKSLNLSLISRMIVLLLRSGERKLPRNRLIEALWPDELFSFDALDLRLKNLIYEARKLKYRVACDEGSIFLKKYNKIPEVIYHPIISINGFEFLYKARGYTFKRKDIEKYFNISNTYAVDLINEWKAKDLVINNKNIPYSYNLSDKCLSICKRLKHTDD